MIINLKVEKIEEVEPIPKIEEVREEIKEGTSEEEVKVEEEEDVIEEDEVIEEWNEIKEEYLNIIVTDELTSEIRAEANTDVRKSWCWSRSSSSGWGWSRGWGGWDWSIDTEELKNNIYVIRLIEVNIKSTNVGEITVSSPVRVEFKKIDSIRVGCNNLLGMGTYRGSRSRVDFENDCGCNISSHTYS